MLGVFVDRSALGQAPLLSPDEEVARRNYAEGEAAYDRADYAAAIAAFERARAAMPMPAFDYNIARAHDRLGQPRPALDAYERYLTAAPPGDKAEEARSRVAILRARLGLPPAAASMSTRDKTTPETILASRPRPKLGLAAPLAVGIGAVAALSVGGALLGVETSRYDDLAGGCTRPGSCDANDVAGLRPYDVTGKVLLGLGGALAAVDVVLWAVRARRARR